ncbi:monovalent cation/H(+) antiporter subunit G [Spelaeicoccus albus]|uniref:monovalent cation/H(+) antiporter subunit G n=1 Tax=Spelaeicoccus albus TaxID=1280376 RepID=UPI001EFFCF76|nr:monovalent cation/H(+) antiporter subunit G [Spelaeicoccus albus]
MTEIRDLISALLLVVGSIMSLSAAIGLLRFPDVLSRMHAATKPQVFGLMCVLLAIALQFPGWATISTLVVVILFQMLTAPVSAHMVGRAAYRTKYVRRDTLLVDELAGAIAKAERRQDDDSASPTPRPGPPSDPKREDHESS